MKDKIPKTDFEKLGEAIEKFSKEFKKAVKELFKRLIRKENKNGRKF